RYSQASSGARLAREAQFWLLPHEPVAKPPESRLLLLVAPQRDGLQQPAFRPQVHLRLLPDVLRRILPARPASFAGPVSARLPQRRPLRLQPEPERSVRPV